MATYRRCNQQITYNYLESWFLKHQIRWVSRQLKILLPCSALQWRALRTTTASHSSTKTSQSCLHRDSAEPGQHKKAPAVARAMKLVSGNRDALRSGREASWHWISLAICHGFGSLVHLAVNCSLSLHCCCNDCPVTNFVGHRNKNWTTELPSLNFTWIGDGGTHTSNNSRYQQKDAKRLTVTVDTSSKFTIL